MAFQTSLSGLNAAQTNLSVTGNNIANASTNGFKRSRAEFSDIYASSFSSTSQVGSGVRVANIGQQFSQGNVEFTDNSLDLSISGEGFFILRESSGAELYTRAGAYQVDRDGFIVNSRDQRLQGYSPTVLGDLRIDNAASPANATTATEINLNLNANAISPIVDATSTVYTSSPITNLDFTTVPATAGTATFDGTQLQADFSGTAEFAFDVTDGVNSTNILLNADYSLTDIADIVADINAQLAVDGFFTASAVGNDILITNTATGAGTSISLANFDDDPNADGASPLATVAGVNSVDGSDAVDNTTTFTLTGPGGIAETITLNTNYADINALAADLSGTGYTVNVGAGNTLEFVADAQQSGEFSFNFTSGTNFIGGSTTVDGANAVVFNRNNPNTYNFSTSTTIYDSLGRGHTQTVFFVKDNTEANTWDTHVFIGDEQIVPANPNDGRVVFNTNGQLVTGTTPISYGTFTPLTDGITGQEANPMEIVVDFDGSTQFAAQSAVNGLFQDGYTSGRISGVNIDSNGVIFARYTNGQSTALGTVALARFENPNGLQPVGDTNWARTFQAGEMVPGMAGTGSLGQIQSGALEASNVDLSASLVNMIIAQRDFQANAKMISTEDAITQTIINIR